MKLKFIVLIGALCLAACASGPTPQQVQQIQAACAADAVIRPSVNVLIEFGNPAEQAAIGVARSIIDPICANPATVGVSANAPLQLAAATGTVACVYGQLQAKKEGKQSNPEACAPAIAAITPSSPAQAASASK